MCPTSQAHPLLTGSGLHLLHRDGLQLALQLQHVAQHVHRRLPEVLGVGVVCGLTRGALAAQANGLVQQLGHGLWERVAWRELGRTSVAVWAGERAAQRAGVPKGCTLGY